MSTTNDKYQPRICRLCLSITATYFSLIDGGEPSKMLEAVTSLKILSTDDISTITCLKCVLKLKLAFILQQNILGAEQRFRQRITQVIKQEVVSNSNDLEEMVVSTEELTPQEVPMTIKDDIDIEEQELQPLVLEGKCESHQCDICDAVLSSQHCLHNHKNSFHKIAALNCEKEENKNGQTSCSLRLANQLEELFACAFCGVKAKSQLLIKQHKDNFHKSKLCRECNKFVQVGSFTQHVNSHTLREKTFTESDDRMSDEKERETTFADDSRPSKDKEKTIADDDKPNEEKEKPNTFSCFTCGEVNPTKEHIKGHFPKKRKVCFNPMAAREVESWSHGPTITDYSNTTTN